METITIEILTFIYQYSIDWLITCGSSWKTCSVFLHPLPLDFHPLQHHPDLPPYHLPLPPSLPANTHPLSHCSAPPLTSFNHSCTHKFTRLLMQSPPTVTKTATGTHFNSFHSTSSSTGFLFRIFLLQAIWYERGKYIPLLTGWLP